MNLEKKKNNYIQLLKFVACILITNSHCIYPQTSHTIASASSLLQIGGGWGNALFFGITGFLSVGKNMDFVTWIKKRYIRIIPITVLFATIKYMLDSPQCNVGWYLVSTYWFVTALVFYYPILFFIDTVSERGYLYGAICYVVGYTIIYINKFSESFFVEPGGMDIFKMYGFFGTALMGAYIKKHLQKIRYIKISICVIICFISVLLWAGVYGAIIFWGRGFEMQFLVTVSRILIVLGTILLSLVCDEKRPLKLREKGIVNLVANATLEIYLVQILAQWYIKQYTTGFTSIIVFWSLAILGGITCHFLWNVICKQVHD